MNDIEMLFKEAAKITYPKGIMSIALGEIKETSFFPGGSGTFYLKRNIKGRKIMVLGQDWGTKAGFDDDFKKGTVNIEVNPTWRNLLKLLREKEIKGLGITPEADCFFTNIILGLREKGGMTGITPAIKVPEFIEKCKDFFHLQLRTQQPEIVLVLGMQTAILISEMDEDKKLIKWKEYGSIKKVDECDAALIKNVRIGGINSNYVLLFHPSFKPVNLKKSNNRNHINIKTDYEIELIKQAMKK